DIELPTINFEIIDIIKDILYLPEKVAKIVIKLSPNIVEFTCLKLSEYLKELNKFFIKTNKLAEEEILRLAGINRSVFESFYSIYGLLKSAQHPSFKFVEKAHSKLVQILKDLHIQYLDMYNSKINNLHPEFLKQETALMSKEKEQVAKKQEEKKLKIIEQSNLEFNDNFNNLMQIPCSNNEVKTKLRAALEKYHKIIDKFDTMGDGRKIKKELDAIYWQFYNDLFLEYIEKGGDLPVSVFLMLRYGVLDDNLLNEDTINCFKATPVETPHTIDIYFADEWLSQIYSGNITPPSINGLGQTFDEYAKENKLPNMDPSKLHLSYEIKEVISAAVRTCAGMISQQSPIIDSDYISLKPDACIVTKERLEKTVKEILEIDYSCFYREVSVMCGDGKEFVQKEVLPYFIILPVAGSKAVCWQELSDRNKSSKGRIMVPLFATDDLKTMLLEAFAHLRWELAKTIAGPNWGDP
ncbi:MAG TPA: hypothetical protein PLJ38_10060, partial [bacterium]|nr:hypothetical protein [bacterium]